MKENKSKKSLWIKVLAILIPLLLGIGIGIAIGMPIGKNKAEQSVSTKVPEVTPVPEMTNQPGAESTETPAVTSQPEVSPVITPDVTKNPKDTPAATQEVTKEPSVEPTATPEVTNQPEENPTKAPSETATPSVTSKPSVTQKPSATPKPTATPIPVSENKENYYGPLHVKGTYLADKDDNLVQLRGISTHGLGWFPQYVNEAAIRQFKQEWGCNVIRLAMYTAEYNGYCTSDAAQKENLKKIIDTGVKAATAENMYVIIDWHILQDNNPNTNKKEALQFFDEMSEKYADNPNVIYEICNEPNGGTTWSMIKSYALEVIPVIRKNAPEAVIIVGTPTWSQDVDIAAKDPITEYDNIMYALHFYADTHRDSLRQKCTKAVQMGLPLFVTEYGTCAASGDGYVNVAEADKWMELLDGYGISHVAWNLSNKGESSSMLSSGCKKVNGFTESDLSTGGKWFVNMLQKAGAGIGAALSGTTEAGQGEPVPETGGASGDGGSPTPDYIAYGEEILREGEGLQITVSNGWTSGSTVGLQLIVTVQNFSNEDEVNWERKIMIKDGVTAELDQNWNSVVELKGNELIIRPVDYNKTIAAGGTVGDIGIILNILE